MVSSGEGPDDVASDELRQKQSPESKTHTPQQFSDGEVHASEKQEGVAPSTNSEQSLQEADGIHISKLDREGIIASTISDKTPSTGSHVSQSGQEGRTPLTPREKLSEDGYHWRKYGQKLVKGNEFIRSYYKCTHSSCQVKKQFERSHDGQITNIVYFGEHDHPKHQVSLPVAVGFVLSVEERAHDPLLTATGEGQAPNLVGSTNASQISSLTSSEDVKSVPSESNKTRDEVNNDDDPRSKRQKKANRSVDPTTADKPAGEPRLVVQTLSDLDIVNDGYRWRKYGQKLVKGNPNPRSYYRCSSPGCPAKKQVERASHDSKLVVASYEGQHDHDIPPSRTVTHNPTGPNNSTTSIEDDDSGAKSGDSDACPSGKAKDQLNYCSGSKSKGSEVPDSNMLGKESKSHEQQHSKPNAGEESDATGVDMVINANSMSKDKSNEPHNSTPKSESIETSSALGTRGPDVSANGQHVQTPEPVQS